MSAFDQLRERLRQSQPERLERPTSAPRAHECVEGRLGCRFTPGARVFDRVTGQMGEVVSGTRENIVTPAPERTDG